MSESRVSNIESLRVLATLLLVTYHAIGPDAQTQLHIDYPHPLRLFADFGIDLRMPLFAFIAGWVYALKPVSRSSFGHFTTRKVKRLVIPGLVAAILLWIVGRSFFSNTIASGAELIEVLTLTFAHYWFIHAILLILLSIALIESLNRAALRHRTLLALALMLLALPTLHVPYVETARAQYLAPYFLFGMVACRRPDFLAKRKHLLVAAALVACAAAAYMNFEYYEQTGILNADRRDLQSGLMSFGLILLLLFLLPSTRLLATFGTLSFTIFLYHPFGTSAARRLMWFFGVENVWFIMVVATIAGVLVPLALHLLLSRWNVTRALFLGLGAKAPDGPRGLFREVFRSRTETVVDVPGTSDRADAADRTTQTAFGRVASVGLEVPPVSKAV